MKLRITALVLLCVALLGTTMGAIIVGHSDRIIAPDTQHETAPQTLPPVITGDIFDTQPATAPVTTEPDATPGHVSVFAAGDNIVLDRIRRNANLLAGGNGDPSQYSKTGFAYTPMYDALRPLIEKSDIAFMNQDSLVWDDPEQNGMTSLLGDQMLSLGFNVISVANNSMLSAGEAGLMKSVDYWSKKDAAVLGINVLPENADQITVVEKNGVKIAFLAYTYGVDGALGEGSELILPLIDKERMTRDVTAAKGASDVIVVYLHWGDVNSTDRSAYQSEIAQHLVDLNVDVILGSHPNVIQEMKWKSRPDGGRTLICYSLGNLISAMDLNKNLLGGAVTFDIDKDENGVCAVSNVKFIPIFTHYDRHYEQISVRLLSDYDQAQLDVHGSSINKGAGSYDFFIRLIKQYVPSEFLEDYYNNYVFKN